MILNLSIGEEIEQDAKEIEGHHIPLGVERSSSSHAGVEETEKTESKAVTSNVTDV
jgi:hypothetical protein